MENEVLKLILSVEDKSVIKATQEAKRLEKEIKALVATEKVLGKEHEIVKQKTIEIKRKLQDYANISSQKAVPTLKKLIQAERSLSLEVDKNTAALTRNTKATKLAADASNQYGTYSITAGKKLNTFNMRVQQTGYQLQDFVVQLQSGTSFFTAFGQQGSQLAGIFGPAGAVFGAVIALGSALGGLTYAAITGKESLKDLGDASSDFESSVSSLENAYSNLDNSEFFDKFGSLKTTFQDLNSLTISLAENISNLEAASAIKAVAATVTEGGPSVFRPAVMGGLSINDILMAGGIGKAQTKAASAGVSESLGGAVSAGQVEVYFKQFEKLADGPVEQLRDKMLEFLNVVKESPKGLGEANLEGLNLLQTIDAVTQSLGRQIALTDGSAQAIKDSAQAEADLLEEVEDLYALIAKEEKDRVEAQKQAAKDAKTYAAGEAAMLKILQKKLDAEKKIDDLIKSRVSKMHEQAALMISEGAYRKAGADETYIQNELEKKKLELYIKQENLNDDQAASLRLALKALQDQEETLKRINIEEQARLSLQSLQVKAIEESPAGQALRKYGARGTRSDKDPVFGTGPNAGKSIYDDPDAGKTFKSTKDEVARLQAVLDLRRQLIGKTQEEAIYLQTLNKLKKANEDADIKMTDTALENAAKRIASDEIEIQKLEDQQQTLQDLASYMGSAYGDALMNIVTDIDFVNDSFEDMAYKTENIFRQMAADIIKELYRVLVVKQMVASVTGFLGFANGGVIQGGKQVQAYANGGVVGGPTYFPMAGGKTGLMGEAGPEAIMPLKRGKGGKLGVEVSGDTGAVNIVQNFSFAANGDESVKKIIAEAAPKIANMTQQQIMDARRRGGQMRSTFG